MTLSPLDAAEEARDAIRVARRVGAWVVYELAEAEDVRLLLGYLRGKIADFERRRKSPGVTDERLRYYRQRVGQWRRAARWVASLDPEHASEIGARVRKILEDMGSVPYVAESEAKDPGPFNPADKLRQAPRARGCYRGGRRIVKDRRPCPTCHGIGWFDHQRSGRG